MACGVGYPEKPCPYNFEGTVSRRTCGACKNFIPPKHILSWCSLWDRDKVLCQLPIKNCATCPFKVERGPGRPLGEGKVDWKDPSSVAMYHSEWQKKNAEAVKAAAERFTKAHPNYFKNYYERNKAKLAANRIAKREQGKGEI